MGSVCSRVWQRLPYRLRRRALFYATCLAAPRPVSGAAAVAPLIVAGALRTSSGLGQSARLCFEALRAGGAEVVALDLTGPLRQTADLPPPHMGANAEPGPGTLILHVNAPLMGLALLAIGRRLAAGKRIIGYWAWELPEVPPEWQLGVNLVHEIWVPSAFTADAVAPITGGRPLHVVPHPVAIAQAPPRPPRPIGAPFTVLCLFDAASSVERKNPKAAIEAFRRAFADDPGTRLILKTQRLDAMPDQRALLTGLADAPNIRLIDRTLDSFGIDALYNEADVLLSLHRAEGFGLTLAEAMQRGLPVVATGWSGNADFLSEAVGVPVPWRLVQAQDPQRTYHHSALRWAEPDIDVAAAALRALRADPLRCAKLGAAAAAYAAKHWDSPAYCARLQTIGVSL